MSRHLLWPLGLAAVLVAPACNPTSDNDQSAVTLTAAFQGEGGEEGAIGIYSDVVGDDGIPEDDFFELNVKSLIKNTNQDPSDFYIVHFRSVTLAFTRPDGENEPGVDVPFPLTYAIGGSVEPGGEANLNLLVVSEEAKLQTPLRELWFGEGQRIFATIHARILGVDQVENAVEATASAVVVFGDFEG